MNGLRYQIRDAEEAMRNAIELRRWENVIKYVKQVQAAETKLLKAEQPSKRRPGVFAEGVPAGWKFGRGKLPG